MVKIYTVLDRWVEYYGTGKCMPAAEVYKAVLALRFVLSDVMFEGKQTTLILTRPITENSNHEECEHTTVRIPVVDGGVSFEEGKVWGKDDHPGLWTRWSDYLGCLEKLGLLKSIPRERWGDRERSPYGIC